MLCKLSALPQGAALLNAGQRKLVADKFRQKCDSVQRKGVMTPSVSSYKADVHLSIRPTLFRQAQEYRLIVRADRVDIVASDLHALLYGITTFGQLLRLFQATERTDDDVTHTAIALPHVVISDWPDIPHRGYEPVSSLLLLLFL
jgi:N-acetyl-beta-hexosaminidase